jgi:Leucine-rich repeat (LRR) protein
MQNVSLDVIAELIVEVLPSIQSIPRHDSGIELSSLSCNPSGTDLSIVPSTVDNSRSHSRQNGEPPLSPSISLSRRATVAPSRKHVHSMVGYPAAASDFRSSAAAGLNFVLDAISRGDSSQLQVPVRLADLDSLTNIGLCSHRLTSLTPAIATLSSATILQLCCNQLIALPREISLLSGSLTVLSLAKNELLELPEEIGYLNQLIELDVSWNRLRTIPRSIEKLKKLNVLRINHNMVTHLPSQIGELTQLISLDVSDNPLQVLPAEVTRLTHLRRLRTRGCPLLTHALHPGEIPPTTPPPPPPRRSGSLRRSSSRNRGGWDVSRPGDRPPSSLSSPEAAQLAEQSVPCLRELVARRLIRENPVVRFNAIPQDLIAYLCSFQECSFCRGPYFEHALVRYKLISRPDTRWPLEYRLCSSHWRNEEERVAVLFATPRESSLSFHQASEEKNPSVVFSHRDSLTPAPGRGRLLSLIRSRQLPPLPPSPTSALSKSVHSPSTNMLLPTSPTVSVVPKSEAADLDSHYFGGQLAYTWRRRIASQFSNRS